MPPVSLQETEVECTAKRSPLPKPDSPHNKQNFQGSFLKIQRNGGSGNSHANSKFHIRVIVEWEIREVSEQVRDAGSWHSDREGARLAKKWWEAPLSPPRVAAPNLILTCGNLRMWLAADKLRVFTPSCGRNEMKLGNCRFFVFFDKLFGPPQTEWGTGWQ